MMNPLVFVHALIAEAGLFAILWVFVELLNRTEPGPDLQKLPRQSVLFVY
jgi:hypothetical protein